MSVLAISASAAAEQCSGGANKRMCGLSWANGSRWDGTQGAGQQMSAMEVVLSNLINSARLPVTNSTGGTSVGNPIAGTPGWRLPPIDMTPPTIGGRIGAGILTVIGIVATMWGLLWINLDWGEDKALDKPLRDYLISYIISYLIS